MFIRIGAPADHNFTQPLGLLSDCHRRIERFLNVLKMTTDQAADRALTVRQRADIEAGLKYFATAARMHIADEEESLFPRLRESTDPAAAHALDMVARLERDHGDAERRHDAVDVLMRRWLADGHLDGAMTGELREHLAVLQRMYREHIAVEDRDLFPAAARLLTPDQIAAIGGEMAARRGLSS
jgi:hemerythrin-like domain-containing protein